MSSIEKLYYDDIRDKAITARSSSHKVTGAKATGCHFPSDFLTEAQKKKLNGECTTWNLKTMTKEEYDNAPADIKKIARTYHPEYAD